MRIMAFLFGTVRKLSTIELLPNQGPLLGLQKVPSASVGISGEASDGGKKHLDGGSGDIAPPAPTGLTEFDGDRAEGEQVGDVASAQAPEAVQDTPTLSDAVASCPQPGGMHHVLRPSMDRPCVSKPHRTCHSM